MSHCILPLQLLSLSGGMARRQNGSPTTAFARPTVVEWRPEECHSDEASLPSTPQDESEGQMGMSEGDTGREDEVGEVMGVANSGSIKEEEEEYMNNVYGSTVTVTIDPPRDSGQGDENDPVYRYLGGGASISTRSKDTGSQRSNDRASAMVDRGDEEAVRCAGGAGVWSKFCEDMEEGRRRG